MRFENIRNFYENLVFNRLLTLASTAQKANEDYLADVACVALNHLPSRYIRHDVDMVFYTSPDEREKIDKEVDEAVKMAIRFVEQQR